MKVYFALALILILPACFVPPQYQLVNIMQLTSPEFEGGSDIPLKFTCDGENVNPELNIRNVPIGTKSLVLVVFDPDVKDGWTHWLLWNIDPGTSKIEENSVPKGSVEGKTSFDTSKYQGPCPPTGTHHYFFDIYALNVKLDLPATADKYMIEAAMKGEIIDESQTMGVYERRKIKTSQ